MLPELDACKGCEQPPQFHPEGDVFVHTRLMLSLLPEEVSVPLVFAVLLHDIGKPRTAHVDPDGRIRFNGHERVGADMAARVMERLRFSRAVMDATVEAVRQHMAFKDVPQMRVAKLKRFMARPGFEDEMELHRVDCLGSHGFHGQPRFFPRQAGEFAHEPLIPKPFVTGHDLLAAGLKPGPKVGEILEAVQTRQLEGAFPDREGGAGMGEVGIPGRGGYRLTWRSIDLTGRRPFLACPVAEDGAAHPHERRALLNRNKVVVTHAH